MKKIVSILIIVAIISVGFVFLHTFDLNPHNHNMICPFSQGINVLCAMTGLEHLESWKNIITSIVVKIFLILSFVLWSRLVISERIKFRYRIHLHNQKQKFFDFYQFLFSDGILNPKTH